MTNNLLYLASLPERLPRALAAGAGGLLYESSLVLLPDWARGAQLYQALIGRMLRITVEFAGGMPALEQADPMTASRLTVRKAAGNAVEFTSILTVGWSPLWMLAAATDVTGGTQVYLHALTDELKRLNVLPPDMEFSSVDNLLDSLEGTTGVFSRAIDIPPLAQEELNQSIGEMRSSWQALRASAQGLPDGNTLRAIAAQMQETAERESISVWLVSSYIGLGAVRAGIKLGQANIFDYYREALGDIGDQGLAGYIGQASRPYFVKAIRHMDPEEESFTERKLRELRIPRLSLTRLPLRRRSGDKT